MTSDEVSLYFHIPFCKRKCDYCHFYVLPDKEFFKDQLMEGLALEWRSRYCLLEGKRVVSIYFGGGTPSLLGVSRLETILSWITPSSDVEVTLEINPEQITAELIKGYLSIGVNRVSIGVQSLDDGLLHLLSRQHLAEKAIEGVLTTYESGIKNISIDLMYDLPGQTLEKWEKTLKRACELPITHLSLYNLTIEPHTVFFKYASSLQHLLPDEEASLAMYRMALEMLPVAHLEAYEISAFARDGHYSCHNVGYWTGRPFLGLGPSAFSYWGGKRFRNVANLIRYTQALKEGKEAVDFSEELDVDCRRKELLVLGLRLREGVNLNLFQKKYGAFEPQTEEIINKLQVEQFLWKKGEYLLLTEKGILFYDTVAVEII